MEMKVIDIIPKELVVLVEIPFSTLKELTRILDNVEIKKAKLGGELMDGEPLRKLYNLLREVEDRVEGGDLNVT